MKYIFCILILLFPCLIFGQEDGIWMHPNKGQWQKPILFKVELNMGEMYIENTGFTYALNDFRSQHTHNHSDKNHAEEEDHVIHSHIIRSVFTESSWNGELETADSSSFYRNYFQGNDPSKWKSNLRSYRAVRMKNFYPNIDLELDGHQDKLKYSFYSKPYSLVQKIEYEIKGAKSVSIDDAGNLHITSRFGDIIEEKPIAWNLVNGEKRWVKVRFKIRDNKVSFEFPNDYDHSQVLVIDPSLTFSSFTGSTADNWGMTATPDSQGNLCAGGIVFNDGGIYPTSLGAFDITVNGGDATGSLAGFDVGISKFNTDGTALIFSTFLGGSANEAPHSLVSDGANNLYILGVTASPNFPVSAGAYDPTYNGGTSITENGLFYNGTDIFVAKLSANGTTLMGSTYVGGTGTDGINSGTLNFNYGDSFRGEIFEENGSIYVSSTTQSSNFPTVSAAQNSLSGTQDAVVFKMNSSLSSMSWSTYFGGNGLETGNSIQVSSTGGVYVAGGTNSNSLSLPSGNDLSFNGGISDGYLVHFNGSTGSIVNGTFIGLSEYDQAYFVQIDLNNDIYVFGQTESNLGISTGLYGTANSGQFIRKYSTNLSTILWTTMIGAGTGHPEISPTAFLVSDCFDIYLSGWGGQVNTNNQAVYSTTFGFQTTADAFQSTTNGSNFYIAVLDQDAAFLKYATFMGGSASSYNHVDGGTSRFDKSGRIYHAVCAACGGNNNGFTTTPGVFGSQNLSSNCNLAAFKFELNKILPVIGDPEPLICMPDPVVFTNNSSNGNTFFWDFGDGSTSYDLNPIHYYTSPGNYTVKLVVSDSNNCFSADSIFFDIEIGDFEGGVITPPTPVCPGIPYQLEAFGGSIYNWSPIDVLDDPTSATPIANIDETTDFTVIISDSCGIDTLYLTLEVYSASSTVSPDTSLCIGNNVTLSATGGGSYIWDPPTFLSDPTSPNPLCSPTTTTSYSIEVSSPDGCVMNDTVLVSVYFDPPVPIIPDTVSMCLNSPTLIQVSGGESYVWSPDYAINTLSGNEIIVNPANDFTYYCDFINACGSASDSVFVDVVFPDIAAGNDTTICPGDPAFLWASGGVSYTWTPINTIINPNLQDITVFPLDTTRYIVTGMDQFGCTDTASVLVSVYPLPFVQTSPNVFAFLGEEVQLSATSTSSGSYEWSPSNYLSCVNCINPIANPDQNYTYTVTFTDENGCKASDNVIINYDGIVYVPNTFTPDGTINHLFKAVGGNIETFHMYVFNRWGELVCEMDSLDDTWDGRYKGNRCQDGTYTWKIIYSDYNDNRKELMGHVNILR